MATFLGVTIESPEINDWFADQSFATINGQQRVVTSEAHRLDVSFTLSDVNGLNQLAPKLKSHYARNRGNEFTIPMLQELYLGLEGSDTYGVYTPAASSAELDTSAKGDAGDDTLRVQWRRHSS